jgi:hypothetical protein
VIGISLAGAGVVALGVGVFSGLRALSLAADVESECPSGPCPREQKDRADDSRSAGTLSTVAFAGGGIAIAAGAALFWLAPRATNDVRIAPAVGATNGVMVVGRFR